MQQRKDFVNALREGLYTVTELCRGYHISRKTAYKWIRRYEEDKNNGLADRSRAPHTCPHRTPPDVEDAIVRVRTEHPTWGPRKVLERLRRQGEFAHRLPAVSTAGDILKRAGLVANRRYRRRYEPAPRPSLEPTAANEIWCADFKGEFLTRDGIWCYPLTVTDAFSRYLLTCQALTSTAHESTKAVLERLFHEVGLPLVIRTDNGCPFGSSGIFGLSRLAIWWMKLGIIHDPIQPGRPQQNGSHERMHRTLKAETARPPAANRACQQERFDLFRSEYNQVRPHQGIGMRTPAELWRTSARPMPATLPAPEYEGHMHVRSVRTSGEIKFKGKLVFVSQVLAGERIALEEIDEGVWSILFYQTLLGRLDEQTFRITPAGRRNRPQV